MKTLTRLFILLFVMTLCLLGQVLFLWAQNQYYVAPNGNDNHDGSFQKPFQTIERAQLEARKAQGETTIYLRKGIYRLERPLIFTPEDGGKEKPLSIRAFRNEQVTLSGGKYYTLCGSLIKKVS